MKVDVTGMCSGCASFSFSKYNKHRVYMWVLSIHIVLLYDPKYEELVGLDFFQFILSGLLKTSISSFFYVDGVLQSILFYVSCVNIKFNHYIHVNDELVCNIYASFNYHIQTYREIITTAFRKRPIVADCKTTLKSLIQCGLLQSQGLYAGI